MKDVVAHLDRWHASGRRAVTATVVAVRKSAPRPPGAKMAVADDGAIEGMVSGGCVEGAVVAAAEEVLAGGAPQLLHFGIADEQAWEVGLPCGGEISVWVDLVEGEAVARFASLAREGGRGAMVTRTDTGEKLTVEDDGTRTGSLGDHALEDRAAGLAAERMWDEHSALADADGVELFVDQTAPPPRLLIFGAVDLSRALCRLARELGWTPYVLDPRGRFAVPERFPEAESVVAKWPRDALAEVGGIDRSTAICVLTHDPKLDDAALAIALRSEAGYVGAMGSRRMQATRRARLVELGLTDAELERLAAPIGLDLGALTVPETALSVMAEVVALRRGRAGGRLRDAAGRIHEVET